MGVAIGNTLKLLTERCYVKIGLILRKKYIIKKEKSLSKMMPIPLRPPVAKGVSFLNH